ncbi:helix-turn-helix transcriptional regulator [Pseudorhodobacter sp.]|uniref:helix-turn-helix domain-containing protein n=1 Tax=Pseudorhodobacter sp. TaxID=1934400 RepID=UPI002B0013D2|nr:helix-turn-helix transcriptional regulator [Pseudorhodobacter sp.]
MTDAKQVYFQELDISDRLRFLMTSEKLTVGELATAAGVSKSAMEKYLSGPSSPRATALASLAANLGLSLEWLFFGYSDNDRQRIGNLAMNALFQLMQDIKQEGPFRDEFARFEFGTRDYTTFALTVANERAEELGQKLWDARRKSMREYANGLRQVALPAIPLWPENPEKD